MTDETRELEPKAEESAQPQEESAPAEAAEDRVEEVEKVRPDTDDKALREARRDAKKADRRAKKLEKEMEQFKRQVAFSQVAGPDEALKVKAAEYDRLMTERFIDESLGEAGLERDDKRLDFSSMESFMYSAGSAQREDAEERLAKKEKDLESLEEKLRADAKAEIEEMKRDLRRDLGLDAVAKPTPVSEGGTTEAEIREKYRPQLEALKGKGSTGEVMVLIREMEAEIAEVQGE